MAEEVKIEEIREQMQEIQNKKTWIRKAFEEAMTQLFLSLENENFDEMVCVEAFKKNIFNPFGEDEILTYYFCILDDITGSNAIQISYVSNYNPDVRKFIFKITRIGRNIDVYDNMTVDEIRRFAKNFDEIIQRLKTKLENKNKELDETINILNKILSALKQ